MHLLFLNKIPKSNLAVTLIEILIATFILGCVVGPILSMFVFASRSTGSSSHRIQAQFLASAVLEAIKAELFRDPNLIGRYSSGFTLKPVKEHTSGFSIFTSKPPVTLFDKIGGLNGPIDVSHSELYEQFKIYKIDVKISGGGKKGVLNLITKVSWTFDGNQQEIEMLANLESRSYEFSKYITH